jgi:hypothetical protein
VRNGITCFFSGQKEGTGIERRRNKAPREKKDRGDIKPLFLPVMEKTGVLGSMGSWAASTKQMGIHYRVFFCARQMKLGVVGG